MKLLKRAALLALTGCMLTGCAAETSTNIAYYDNIEDGYNPTLFYQNDITDFGADPGVLYIDDETDKENYGYFYLYPTCDSDLLTMGITAYRSKDLVNWEPVSVAYFPDEDSYGNSAFWAPECIFDAEADRSEYGLGEGKGVYYLFYSSNDKDNPNELVFSTHAEEAKYKEAEARVEAMTLAAVESELATYKNSEEVNIKVIISDYESMKQGEEVDVEAEAKNALLEIIREGLECWRVINDYSIGVAVSTSPAGPFVQYTRENPEEGERTIAKQTPFICSEDMTEYGDAINKILTSSEVGFSMIDPNPFVDPVTGKKYLFFVRRTSRKGIETHFVCGMEMGDSWTDDPKWETLTRLTSCGYTEVNGDTEADIDINTINEGPFVYYKDGTYYLTYSVGNYNNATYSVCQALSDSPLGNYTKLSKADGGYILVADGREDISGAGHHCFVEHEDELYIVYHAHWDRVNKSGQRGFQTDRIFFTENNNKQTIMQCNGPTVVPMPILGSTAEYKNIATDATVTATKCNEDSIQYLNDDKIATISYIDFVKEFESKGDSKITLTFEDYRTVRALMIFNSKDSSYLFDSVKKIKLYYQDEDGNEKTAMIHDLKFDAENLVSDTAVVTRCASAIAEFDELKCNKIELTFAEDAEFNVSEIYVLGK